MKFWALAKKGQTSALKGKDIINGYILLLTACDGTLVEYYRVLGSEQIVKFP